MASVCIERTMQLSLPLHRLQSSTSITTVPGAFSPLTMSTSVPTSDLAYKGIREMLARDELVPAQRRSQSRLTRELGCSPMPVVEAMRRLESEGLLVKQARKQARVRKLSREDLEGLYLLREAIESVTARLAAQRATSAETQALHKLAQAYERAWKVHQDDSDADVAMHRHPHRALIQASVDHDA